MNARAIALLAILIVAYLAIGGGVYLIAYGEPIGFPLSLAVVLAAWPFALVWWSLWWIGIVVVGFLVALGVLHIWDRV